MASSPTQGYVLGLIDAVLIQPPSGAVYYIAPHIVHRPRWALDVLGVGWRVMFAVTVSTAAIVLSKLIPKRSR